VDAVHPARHSRSRSQSAAGAEQSEKERTWVVTLNLRILLPTIKRDRRK
jgi:hypothetical protein